MAYSYGDKLIGTDFQVLLDKTEANMLQITNYNVNELNSLQRNVNGSSNIKDTFIERFQLQMAQCIQEWVK